MVFFYLGFHLASSADRKWRRCAAESAAHSSWSDRLVTWHCGEAPHPRWQPETQTERPPSSRRGTWQRPVEASNPPGASWHTVTEPLEPLQGQNTQGDSCNTGEREGRGRAWKEEEWCNMQGGEDFRIWRPLPSLTSCNMQGGEDFRIWRPLPSLTLCNMQGGEDFRIWRPLPFLTLAHEAQTRIGSHAPIV